MVECGGGPGLQMREGVVGIKGGIEKRGGPINGGCSPYYS